MKGQKIGYIRVSSITQNTDRQLDGMELDKIFTDKCSGSKKNRPNLQACIEHTREGDILYVHSMDRLARSLTHLKQLVDDFNSKGVEVHFIKENLVFKGDSSPMDNFLLNIIGAVAEFERGLINERQKEGIALAKRKGKHLGRSKTLSQVQVKELKALGTTSITKTDLAKKFHISRATLYRYLKV